MSRRPFTLNAANALIPALEDAFQRIDRQKDDARAKNDRLQVLELLWGDGVREPDNPDHEEAEECGEAIALAIREIRGIVRREILDRGLRFPQGGLAEGLVDFPTTWQGRWVYLCWHRGESEIVAWHEVDAGFSGRQQITRDQADRMGVEEHWSDLDDSVLDF